jgi:hypothetical protein
MMIKDTFVKKNKQPLNGAYLPQKGMLCEIGWRI